MVMLKADIEIQVDLIFFNIVGSSPIRYKIP